MRIKSAIRIHPKNLKFIHQDSGIDPSAINQCGLNAASGIHPDCVWNPTAEHPQLVNSGIRITTCFPDYGCDWAGLNSSGMRMKMKTNSIDWGTQMKNAALIQMNSIKWKWVKTDWWMQIGERAEYVLAPSLPIRRIPPIAHPPTTTLTIIHHLQLLNLI